MANRDPIERGLVGPAGEHFVLFRLYRQGMLASLSPPGLSTVDILVLGYRQDVVATVQVKARTTGSDRGWHMRDKHESVIEDRHFYVFVDLEDEPPTCYVVPSAKVAAALKAAHSTWLATPGRGGAQHRDNPMRRILPTFKEEVPGHPPGWLDQYRERWDLLAAAV